MSKSRTRVLSGYSLSPDGFPGRVKSPIIYGHDAAENCAYPIAYIRKPKWMTKEAFMKVVNAIELKLPKGTTLEHNDD